jgi:hypothetical protein
MSNAQLARTGVGVSILGLTIGQFWLVGGIFVLVGGIALGIRYSFRRGRSPRDH